MKYPVDFNFLCGSVIYLQSFNWFLMGRRVGHERATMKGSPSGTVGVNLPLGDKENKE
jgi:hypothetical protein